MESDFIGIFLILLFYFYADQQAMLCSLDNDYKKRLNNQCQEFLVVNQDSDRDLPPWNLVSSSIQYDDIIASGTANASLSTAIQTTTTTL